MFAALYSPSTPVAVLVGVARAFTPRFEQIGPLVLLDASGLSRLFGNPRELGEYLRDALDSRQAVPSRQDSSSRPEVPSRHETRSRVAIAFTQTAAALLALGRPGLTVVEPGQEAAALAPLGVSVLDVYERLTATEENPQSLKPQASSPVGGGWHHPRNTHQASRRKRRVEDNRQLAILTKWGIRTLGALAALAGPDVFERLGDRGVEWQAFARGEDARPLVPWIDEVPCEAAIELEWPIEGLEPLSFVLARLLEPLSEQLERADRGAAVLITSLRLTTKAVVTRTLQLPAPMRDPKTLRTLILLDLETHPPDAPIDTVRVVIEPTPGRVLQWTLLARAQPAPEQVSTLIARLTALMGDGHVGAPCLVDTWRPGAFVMSDFRCEIAGFGISDFRLQISDRLKKSDGSIGDQSSNHQSAINHQAEICNLKSALRRFRLPIPARVQVQEGRPIRVTTDRQGFTSGAIVQAAGPWRTSGEWWEAGQAWDRDEWDVAMTDGTLYRLVVERGVGQWFLEGVVD